MRITRIYQPGHYRSGQTIELSKEASRHVATVLRLQPGEHITLFRNDNIEFMATIVSANKKGVVVTVTKEENITRESPRGIHIAQTLSKGDRMEFVIQKAVELGVTSITPLFSSRCSIKRDHEKLTKKHAKWQSIAISACEQSGRNQIPEIRDICTFSAYLEQCEAEHRLLLDTHGHNNWRQNNLSPGDIAVLIGPEGGFSASEIDQAKSANFKSLRLGPRTLRTETAALAAITLLQALYGDL